MGISVLSLGFVVCVPSSPGHLFLCLSCVASCHSNLLAGASLKTTEGVKVAALEGVRMELVVMWHREDFTFPSSGPASRSRNVTCLGRDHGSVIY